jgi:hypothetical protein
MKRWILLCAAAAVAAFFGIAAYRFFTSGSGERQEGRTSKAFRCVRTVSAYAALIENPTAARVLLLGDLSGDYREFFEHAGLVCETEPKGEFDIVFAAGEWTPRQAKLSRKALARDGAWAECIDARELMASAFKARLEAIPGECVHVWMPGEKDWVVIARPAEARPRLDDMMELFAREGAFKDLADAQCDSLPVAFASYAGTREGIMPAFNGEDAPVEPENFVTRDVEPVDWIAPGTVDADIRDAALKEMRSMQIVRRIVLVGDMQAGRHDEEKSVEVWARAALRNPGDTILVERLERLSVNAQTFLKLGKAAMAAKCYDTMAQVCPNDPLPVYNYGVCMRQLGEHELADLAFKRADELAKARESQGEGR